MARIRAGATTSEFNMSARPWTTKMGVPLLWESQYSTDNSASEARTDISGVATALTVTNLQHDTATITGSATISTRFLRLDVKSSEEPKGSKSALACMLLLLLLLTMMMMMVMAKNDDGTDAVAGDVDEADENIEARQPHPESKISSNHRPQCWNAGCCRHGTISYLGTVLFGPLEVFRDRN